MTKSVATRWLVIVVLAWTTCGPAMGEQAAGPDPVAQLPPGTLAFLRINSVDGLLTQLGAMTKPLGAGIATMAAGQVRNGLGEAAMSEGLEGLDTKDALIIAWVDPGPRQVPGQERAQPGQPDLLVLAKPTSLKALQAAVAKGAKNVVTKPSQHGYTILEGGVEQFDFKAVKDAEEDAEVESKVKKKLVTRRWFFLERGGYVLYGRNERVVQAAAKAKTAFGQGMHPEDKQWLASCQAGVYVDLKRLVRKYRAPLQQAKMVATMAMAVLQMGGAQGGGDQPAGPPPPQMAMLAKVLPDVINGVFQFVFDTRSLCAVGSVGAAGATLTTVVRVGGKTASARRFRLHKPGAMKSLGLLSTGSPVYVGFDMNMNVMLQWAKQLVDEQGVGEAVGMSPEQIDKFLDSMDAYASAKMVDVAESFSFGDDKKPGGGVALMGVENVKPLQGRSLADEWKAFAPLQGFEVEGAGPCETYKDVKIDVCRVKIDMQAAAGVPKDAAQGLQNFMTGMMGGEKFVMRQAIVKKCVIVTWGVDPAPMHRAIDAVQAGAGAMGQSNGYRKIRAALPARTNVLALIDLPEMVRSMAALMSKAGMALPVAPAGQADPGEANFMALSVRLGGPAIRVDLVLPTEQLVGLKKLVAPEPQAPPEAQ